jgi:hypothetical protein
LLTCVKLNRRYLVGLFKIQLTVTYRLVWNWIDGILLAWVKLNWRCSVGLCEIELMVSCRLVWNSIDGILLVFVKLNWRYLDESYKIVLMLLLELIRFKFDKWIWWYCSSMTSNEKCKKLLDGKRKIGLKCMSFQFPWSKYMIFEHIRF